MPDNEDPENTPRTADVIKTLLELITKDDEFKKTLGTRTAYFIVATLAIAAVELTYGIPIITLASTPFVGAIIVFLYAQVEDWIRSGKPKIIFYICSNKDCPNPERFRLIKWAEISRFRKINNCSDCGKEFIKRCPNRHYIISPSIENPELPPNMKSFCPNCGESYLRKEISNV